MPPKEKPVCPAATKPYLPPVPTAVVIWRHVPGGDPTPALVTKIGRQAISVMLFPPDSRVGTPKDAVMHVSDPRVKTLVNPESGVWDYTDEHKILLAIARNVIPNVTGAVDPIAPEAVALLANLLK